MNSTSVPRPETALSFDPTEGTVVRTPPGPGYGNWVGGKVSYDAVSGQFVLFFRERKPLELGRAGRCGVAVSADGLTFEEVWSATKEQFSADSIEEGHCVRHGEEWWLYVSYEIARTGTWRIDVLTAASPDGFDAQSRRTVLWPGDYGLPWIKDPHIYRRDEEWWLYAAVPPRTGPRIEGDVVHAGPLDATVLAVSQDGRYFPTIEYVFEPTGEDNWHGRRARINSVMPWGDGYVAMWDGGRTFYDNYEEWAGIATSPDGRIFERVATGGPWVRSPYGAVRYVGMVPVESQVFMYYEYTRQDGAHELRASVVTPSPR